MNSFSFKSAFSWHISAIFSAGLMLGVAMGATLGFWMFLDQSTEIGYDLAKKTARVNLLEILVVSQTKSSLNSLDSIPVDKDVQVEVASMVPAASSQGVSDAEKNPKTINIPEKVSIISKGVDKNSQKKVDLKNSGSKPSVEKKDILKKVDKNEKVEKAVAISIAPMIAPTVVPSPVVASPLENRSEAVTMAELSDAQKTKIEGVSSDKAGVLRIDKDGVHLKNGSHVKIGQKFPSGEKLLQIDLENSKVLTSDRQMLLFFQK